MSLVDLCEPLFQYMCRLNRSARKGGNTELNQVQYEIKGFLAEAKSKAASMNLADSFAKIELPLIFFCDFMIKESSLFWARDWKELAFERKEMTGNKKFFDLLEETLKDQSTEANDRLAIFYTCIGLGFTGAYTGQPEYLQRKMREISARLHAGGQFQDTQRICADAYEKVDTRDLIEPPGTRLIGIAIALVGLIIVLFVAYGMLFHSSSKELKDAVDTVKQKASADPGGKESGK